MGKFESLGLGDDRTEGELKGVKNDNEALKAGLARLDESAQERAAQQKEKDVSPERILLYEKQLSEMRAALRDEEAKLEQAPLKLLHKLNLVGKGSSGGAIDIRFVPKGTQVQTDFTRRDSYSGTLDGKTISGNEAERVWYENRPSAMSDERVKEIKHEISKLEGLLEQARLNELVGKLISGEMEAVNLELTSSRIGARIMGTVSVDGVSHEVEISFTRKGTPVQDDVYREDSYFAYIDGQTGISKENAKRLWGSLSRKASSK